MEIVESHILAECGQLWHKSHDHEELLHHLRQNGASKLDSIKAIREICAVSLGEAKRIVTLSAEWQDTLDSTSKLHNDLTAALNSERQS